MWEKDPVGSFEDCRKERFLHFGRFASFFFFENEEGKKDSSASIDSPSFSREKERVDSSSVVYFPFRLVYFLFFWRVEKKVENFFIWIGLSFFLLPCEF